MKIGPVGFALIGVISYLSYHAIAGQQGLSRWTEMQANLAELRQTKSELLAKRARLESQTDRLYEETLDLDFLEELARVKLHFVHPDEFVLEPPTMSAQLPENEELFALRNP